MIELEGSSQPEKKQTANTNDGSWTVTYGIGFPGNAGYIQPSSQQQKTQTTEDLISEVMNDIHNLLLEKNRKYGDSALSPVRVFSSSNPLEQIRVRIDDKISRIKSKQLDEDEDVIIDLIGYLVLLLVAKKK